MRLLIAFAAALFLAACASTPAPQSVQASAAASPTGFATLAAFGTWEMELAPAYTRLAVLRHRAARLLDARRIDVATAVRIQTLADRSRVALDASRRGSATEPTPEQRERLEEAMRLLGEAQTLMEP